LNSEAVTKIKKFEVENNDLYNNRIIHDPISNKKVIKKVSYT